MDEVASKLTSLRNSVNLKPVGRRFLLERRLLRFALSASVFSMATSRYDVRKNDEEARGQRDRQQICPGWPALRCGCGKNPQPASPLSRSAYRFLSTSDRQELQQINIRASNLRNEMWSAVQAAALSQPTPVTALVVSGMNDVLNSRGYTLAA